MKTISDIRLFVADGNPRPAGINNKEISLAAHRVAMKLREKEFSLGDFDHLYLVFSADYPAGSVTLDRRADRYFPWLRYVYAGVTQKELADVNSTGEGFMFAALQKALTELFCDSDEKVKLVLEAIAEAGKGEEMLMHFKEKKGAKGTATVYLRLMDNARYLPLLCVTKTDGTEVLRADLPETADLGILGDIRLSGKKVSIKPRKNAFTRDLVPITFDIEL